MFISAQGSAKPREAALKSHREGNMLILVDVIFRINLDLRGGGSGVVTVIPFKIKGDSCIA